MIKDLIKLSEYIEENTLLDFFYDFGFDGTEIDFRYYIMKGFETETEGRRICNACDLKTNINSFYHELVRILRFVKA